MVSGIICEFNPFHNGHKYLLDSAKKNSDFVVCVMSGNFTQRGEIAFFEKHIRTEMALKNGADIVIDLPAAWSMSGAENFAFGGISLLNSCGIVDKIVFGCENNNLDLLKKTADLLEDKKILSDTKHFLTDGITFAKARQTAISQNFPDCAEILDKPNNILAIQYISASQKIGYNVKFEPVLRVGVDHDSEESVDNFTSASNLRSMILNNDISSIKKYVPENIFEIINKKQHSDFSLLDTAIMFKLRSLTLEDIKKLPDISEGIENRIFEKIKVSDNFDELLNNIKTKRYTLARIRRILMCAAFNIDNTFINQKPPYIKILGYKESSKELLSQIAKKADIPVIINSKDIDKLDNFGKKVFNNELISSDLYSLAFKKPYNCNIELTLPVVKI